MRSIDAYLLTSESFQLENAATTSGDVVRSFGLQDAPIVALHSERVRVVPLFVGGKPLVVSRTGYAIPLPEWYIIGDCVNACLDHLADRVVHACSIARRSNKLSYLHAYVFVRGGDVRSAFSMSTGVGRSGMVGCAISVDGPLGVAYDTRRTRSGRMMA